MDTPALEAVTCKCICGIRSPTACLNTCSFCIEEAGSVRQINIQFNHNNVIHFRVAFINNSVMGLVVVQMTDYESSLKKEQICGVTGIQITAYICEGQACD